jgi:NADH oxidase (H2O-forming)
MKDDKVLAVSDSVNWVGVLDPALITFDIVMETKYGTTYNAYFIDAEKKALIETVKDSFCETYIRKLKTLTDLSKIEYIILNHTEPDHSGSLKAMLELIPEVTVVGSGQALNYLQEMVGRPFKSLKVKDGDSLSLGNKTLEFIGAPNLHWPDSIYTWLKEEKVLFTCDSFGAHYCNKKMFNDEVGDYEDAFRYYFDVILKPFSKFMLKAIEKIKPLPITVICPGHGPILRKEWEKAVDSSREMAQEYLETVGSNQHHVLVTYVSAYGYTRDMAENIAVGIRETATDANVEVVDIERILLGDLEEKLVKARAVLVGSPTINQNTLLPIYKFFALVNPIRDKGKLAASFGSYGWSGEAVEIIDSQLKTLKFNVPFEGLAGKFSPVGDKVQPCIDFGKKFGEELLKEA